jgi:hypothetical protein
VQSLRFFRRKLADFRVTPSTLLPFRNVILSLPERNALSKEAETGDSWILGPLVLARNDGRVEASLHAISLVLKRTGEID